jgi:GTPase involved in cell partitioning and DNA repair
MEPSVIDYYNKYPQIIQVIDNLNIENHELQNELKSVKEELNFYKSIFITHRNSVVYNLYDKYYITEDNKKVKIWIDKIRCDKRELQYLEQDEDVIEWQKPVKCER